MRKFKEIERIDYNSKKKKKINFTHECLNQLSHTSTNPALSSWLPLAKHYFDNLENRNLRTLGRLKVVLRTMPKVNVLHYSTLLLMNLRYDVCWLL